MYAISFWVDNIRVAVCQVPPDSDIKIEISALIQRITIYCRRKVNCHIVDCENLAVMSATYLPGDRPRSLVSFEGWSLYILIIIYNLDTIYKLDTFFIFKVHLCSYQLSHATSQLYY